MSGKTPAHRRREGREAFAPQYEKAEALENWCPYSVSQWGGEDKRNDWIEGWDEAKKAYDKEYKDRDAY